MGQIEDFRLFIEVVDQESISKAANKLNIAKSAVSRRLALLEDRYSAKLINREPGNWSVTTTGRELYQRAVRLVGDMDEIDTDFKDVAHRIGGSLTISVPQEFGQSALRGFLLDFSVKYPEIQLTLTFENRFVDLEHENYDFAIRISNSKPTGFSVKHIGCAKHQLYASRDYIEKHGMPKDICELTDHKILGSGIAKRSVMEFTSDSGKPIMFPFQSAMSCNSGMFLIDATLRSLGICRLPDFVAKAHVDRGELLEVLPDIAYSDLGIYLIHAESRRLNKRMRLFSDELDKLFDKAE
ncbi:MAG: LysR family transcriptional regulator [Rhizobiaceae bacterium]|nr:LysR family transcriptional regulator [Rhizobiaceae bacterium]